MAFEFLGTRVEAGQSAIVNIPVCRMASGAPLNVAVHVVCGEKPGPAVALVSAHHGEELFTTELLRQLKAKVQAGGQTFSGTLLFVPLANPPSFEWGTRNTPIDLHNLNRVFPGNRDGWFTDMLAAALWEALVPKVDAVLDYHCGGVDTNIHYTYTLNPGTPFGRQVHELAMLASAEVLWETHHPGGSFAGMTTERGIPTVILEVGGGPCFGTPMMERGLAGTQRILQRLGVLPGEPGPGEGKVVVRGGGSVRPHHGGLYLPEVGLDQIGTSVPKGTVLGRVVAPDTFEELEVIRAPYEPTWLMMIRSRPSKVHPGDYAYILGDGSTGSPVDGGTGSGR